MNINNCNVNINDLRLDGVVGPNSHNVNQSNVSFGTVSLDGVAPEIDDRSWNLNMSNMNVNNWLHDGVLTSNFFNINNLSSITINNGSMINTLNTLFNSNQLSSVNLNNLTATECSCIVNAFESRSVRMNNVTNEGPVTNPGGNLINIEGGEIFLTAVTGYAGTGTILNASDVQARLQNNNFYTGGTGAGAYFVNSSLQAFNTYIGATAGTALVMQTDTFRIDGFTGYSLDSVIKIQQNSKGYLSNTHGNSSTAFGVDLQSGSSFSNQGNNDVSGAGGPGTNDVNTGNAGSSSWGALITDDFPPAVTPSQYVTISPA